MADLAKTKTKETKGELQLGSQPGDANPEMINLKPLPNNRPIARNVTEDSNELMGYLD